MRILILGINFTPELTGIGKYTGELVQFLTRQGHLVHMVTAPPYYPHWRVADGYRAWVYRKELIDGAQVIRCPLWVPRHPRGFTRLLHLASFALSSFPIMLAQARWKPQLVFCVAPAIASAPSAWLLARLSGGKAWLHIQDFELDAALQLKMLPGLGWARHLLQRLERLLLHRFDLVSSISPRMISHLESKGVSRETSYLFENWVDCSQIFPHSRLTSLRSQWGFTQNTSVVLYSGSMGQKQGLESLIESARLVQNEPTIQFVLCGDGAARTSLQQQAADLKNVHFYPLVPFDQLNELLNTADIHVLTQHQGAADLVMPSKLSAMLASGRPVIATALPGTGLAEVVLQTGLLVPPENPSALANAIHQLSSQPDLRQELAQRGRSFALDHWNKPTVLNSWMHAVESLCL